MCLAVLAYRAWPRLHHQEIWAEDGMMYLPDALRLSWGSLLVPVGGFYQLVPRALITLWSRVLPPADWPIAINVSALVLAAAVLAIPVGRAYGWIIPDIRARFLLCLMFCLTPGLNEMIGNYPNLSWFFFFALAFMGLRDPVEPIPLWGLLLSAFLIASMAQAVFALPLFTWRVAESLRRRRTRAHLWRSVALLTALCVSIWVLWLIRESPDPLLPHAARHTLFLAFAKTTADSLLLLPLAGDRLAVALSGLATPWPRVVALVVMFAALMAAVIRLRERPAMPAVVLLTLGVACWPAVSWIARPGNLAAFLVPLDDVAIRHRYAFPSGLTALLLWMFLIHASRWSRSWKMALSLALLAGSLGIGTDRFTISAYGAELKWYRIAWFIERARTTGCPNPIVGSIYPGRWTFEYEDPRRPHCEAK